MMITLQLVIKMIKMTIMIQLELMIILILILFLIFVRKQSQELMRVNPDRNIFSINAELKSTFLLYRGLVHHHHRILNNNNVVTNDIINRSGRSTILWSSIIKSTHG